MALCSSCGTQFLYSKCVHEAKNGDFLGDSWDFFVHRLKLTGLQERKMIPEDIVGIIDSNGNRIVNYSYDSWGRPVSMTDNSGTGAGSLNHFRYRGYFYDEETGWYYLKSRYYDPEVGRFINTDKQLNNLLGIVGMNLFSYCLNNPINKIDLNGNKPGDLFDTPDEAAKDFAEYINARSIAIDCEFGSYILKTYG